MSIYKMDIGKKGYCMVSGHATEHELTLECWRELRTFLFDRQHLSESENYKEYVRRCKNK